MIAAVVPTTQMTDTTNDTEENILRAQEEIQEAKQALSQLESLKSELTETVQINQSVTEQRFRTAKEKLKLKKNQRINETKLIRKEEKEHQEQLKEMKKAQRLLQRKILREKRRLVKEHQSKWTSRNIGAMEYNKKFGNVWQRPLHEHEESIREVRRNVHGFCFLFCMLRSWLDLTRFFFVIFLIFFFYLVYILFISFF